MARLSARSRGRNGARPPADLPAPSAAPAEHVLPVQHTDIARLMSPAGGPPFASGSGGRRRQSLAGFDADYVDIVNYIVRCTHKIWEEMGMGLIYTHYRHNAKVYTGDGWFLGRDQVVANSIQALAAMPDDRAYAEAVVWTGDDQAGFYTSHLILSVGHHTGHSFYGPPSGRKVLGSGIALCFVKDNLIGEEWLLHDDVGAIRQLGLDVDETVARLAERDAAKPLNNSGDLEHRLGQSPPEPLPVTSKPGTGFEVDDFLRRNLHEIWNRRMFNVIRDVYAPDVLFHRAQGHSDYGRGDYTAFVLSLLAAFPDGRFSIDQLYWNVEGPETYRTSMRWSLIGTHAGYGVFGEPTGQRVRVWGLTQHVIRAGRIVDEWTFINELAILKQLYLARRAKTAPA
jgi:predicted ester cyclase